MSSFRYVATERITIPDVGRSLLFTLLGALLAGFVLAWLAGLRGSVGSIEPAASELALQAGGADPLVAIGYLSLGLVRVYLTTVPLVLFVAGVLTASIDRAWGTFLAVALGMGSASTLTVLTGCHCGDGATAFLLQRAIEALTYGTAPLPV